MSTTSKTVAGAAAVGVAIVGGSVVHRYVDSDGGGDVAAYVRQYDDLRARGVSVVIRGACYSSCTMGLGYDNVCLAPGAQLGFHPAYTPFMFGLFHYALSDWGTQEMRRHYPADALAVIDARRGLVDKGGWMRPAITVISAHDFPRHYLCK